MDTMINTQADALLIDLAARLLASNEMLLSADLVETFLHDYELGSYDNDIEEMAADVANDKWDLVSLEDLADDDFVCLLDDACDDYGISSDGGGGHRLDQLMSRYSAALRVLQGNALAAGFDEWAGEQRLEVRGFLGAIGGEWDGTLADLVRAGVAL